MALFRAYIANACCNLTWSNGRPNKTLSCTVPEMMTAPCGAYPVSVGATDSDALPALGCNSPIKAYFWLMNEIDDVISNWSACSCQHKWQR